MPREYFDEKILSVKRKLDDEKARTVQEGAIEKEIAAQNVTSGAVTIYGENVLFAPRLLLDEKVILFVPQAWTDMPPEAAKIKYPLGALPPVILTDETLSINIAVNHLPAPLKPDPEAIAGFALEMKTATDKMMKAATIYPALAAAKQGNGWKQNWMIPITAAC